MTPHYEASLQRDLERIHTKLSDMASRAEAGVADAVNAFVNSDRQRAYSVILRDSFIDDLDRQIDRLALEFIVRHQPAGLHLRFAGAVIKVNLEIERVGDYAKSIAKQVHKLVRLGVKFQTETYRDLSNRVLSMFHDSVQAFIHRDADAARAVVAAEAEVDAVRTLITEQIFAARQTGTIPPESLNPLTNIARRLERVGDQAKNIAQEVIYMVTGEYAKHRDSDVLRVLFVDATNSRGSQIAEAIGQSIGDEHFLFSSAGVEPSSVDPETVKFMLGKGTDLSGAKAKTIEQIPNLDYYQVWVSLSPRARAVLPPRTVNLEWTIEDPANLEATHAMLKENITDLVAALLGEKAQSRK